MGDVSSSAYRYMTHMQSSGWLVQITWLLCYHSNKKNGSVLSMQNKIVWFYHDFTTDWIHCNYLPPCPVCVINLLTQITSRHVTSNIIEKSLSYALLAWFVDSCETLFSLLNECVWSITCTDQYGVVQRRFPFCWNKTHIVFLKWELFMLVYDVDHITIILVTVFQFTIISKRT